MYAKVLKANGRAMFGKAYFGRGADIEVTLNVITIKIAKIAKE